MEQKIKVSDLKPININLFNKLKKGDCVVGISSGWCDDVLDKKTPYIDTQKHPGMYTGKIYDIRTRTDINQIDVKRDDGVEGSGINNTWRTQLLMEDEFFGYSGDGGGILFYYNKKNIKDVLDFI